MAAAFDMPSVLGAARMAALLALARSLLRRIALLLTWQRLALRLAPSRVPARLRLVKRSRCWRSRISLQ